MVARTTPNLVDSLRRYRTDQAYLRAVPPFAVFSNKLLVDIASKRPSTLGALSELKGMGPTRSERYGRDIVRLVNLDAKRKETARKSVPPIKAARKKEAKGRRKPKVAKGVAKVKTTPKKAAKAKKAVKQPLIPQIVTSRFFPASPLPEVIPPRLPPSPKASVYILELEDGRVYVGSSRDVPRRITQHAAGSGSAYTRVYPPTGVQLPRLGNVEGDGDAAERDETLRYMMLRGIPYVRGWKFARVDMTAEEFDEAESNIRELFDLCRKCGYKGPFCTHCRATFDRLGNPVKS